MSARPVILGAISIAAVAALAGCGGSSSATPTPSGLSIPGIPGLTTTPGSGSSGGGSASAATLLAASDVQTISGDPNVAAVSGTCSATTCVYADTTSTGGGGGVIVVEPFPGGLGQAALEAAVAGALSAGGSGSNGGTTAAVSGLGSAAIKEIDANSATYAFSKDNYLVVINVTSATNTGAAMDAQVEAAAQTAAGQI
ncbi:MAG TPA: hypothetical protein VND88_11285 [Candidatus Acidoferrales bacterium]|jgi:hypothetical protein|nr:hypothetical protein [Candidatus Saccharimonadales bacterium]HVC05246.1 hypothetical protein [Candidatus Acidoferrales bacterium]